MSDFMPHGMCFLWEPELLWLHVSSDILTGIAYFAIPPTLLVLMVRARRVVLAESPDRGPALPHDWMLIAFGLFIIACGSTHFFAAWNIWNTDYWLSGAVKAVTAVASIGTAIALPPLVPRFIDLIRDARATAVHREELRAANEELRQVRDRLQQELKSATGDVRELTEEVTQRQQAMDAAIRDAEQARDQAVPDRAGVQHQHRDCSTDSQCRQLARPDRGIVEAEQAVIGFLGEQQEVGRGVGPPDLHQRARTCSEIRRRSAASGSGSRSSARCVT